MSATRGGSSAGENETRLAPSLMGVEGWEAFVHAVFAIAITLLVLDIPVPPSETTPDAAALIQALLAEAPRYAAYLLGFMYVGTYWIATHRALRMLRGVDQSALVISLIYLMFIALVPFIAALLAEYIAADRGRGEIALVLFVGWQLILQALAYLGFVYWRRAGLLRPELGALATRSSERMLLASIVVWSIVLIAGLLVGPAALLLPAITFLFSWNLPTPGQHRASSYGDK